MNCTNELNFIQDDDGFIIYESRAVCHYIATKYADQGTPLLPTELKANTLFHQAASIEAFHFDALAIAAVNEHMYKPWVVVPPPQQIIIYIEVLIFTNTFFFRRFQGLEPNEAIYDKAIADLNKQLDVYDKILAKQKYLAGDVSVVGRIIHCN